MVTRTGSAYWLPEAWVERFQKLDKHSPEYVMRLASVRRGIASFVRIMTGKSIPVHFSSGKQSFATSNDIVVISATANPEKFDANCGIALHESAHLILSKLHPDVPESTPLYDFLDLIPSNITRLVTPEMGTNVSRLGHDYAYLAKFLKRVINILEDRRIDAWVYRNAKGYRVYYDAMYNEHWHNPKISIALMHPLSHRPTLKFYRLHITNMSNPFAVPDALPGLERIRELVDLQNIDRLDHDPKWKGDWKAPLKGYAPINRDELPEIVRIALEIVEIVLQNAQLEEDVKSDREVFDENGEFEMPPFIESGPPSKEQNESEYDEDDENSVPVVDDEEDGEQFDDPSKDYNFDQPDETEDEGDQSEGDTSSEGDEKKGEVDTEGDGVGGDEPDEKEFANFKDSFDEKAVDEALENQEKVTDGEIEKEDIDPDIEQSVEAVESAGTELKGVGRDLPFRVPVTVFNEINEHIIASNVFSFTRTIGGIPQEYQESVKAIKQGEGMGNLLAHRLKIMADENVTTFTRQRSGRMDKRLLAGLGYGDEHIFKSTLFERHDPVFVHFSIDASTSMEGEKWRQSLALAVALAKASEKLPTLEVVISVRAGGHSGYVPQIAIIFDSKKHRFVHVRKFFKYLHPYGGTPEGLCFEAIQEQIVRRGKNRRFFINISDGEPAATIRSMDGGDAITGEGSYMFYVEENAWKHTGKQVAAMRAAGVTVLSYFVSNKRQRAKSWFVPTKQFKTQDEQAEFAFRMMYGRDAAFINPESIQEIARTLNRAFL